MPARAGALIVLLAIDWRNLVQALAPRALATAPASRLNQAPEPFVRPPLRRNLPFLIFSAAVLAALLALGTWQVRRLEEKRAYLDALEAVIAAAPVAIPAQPDPVSDRFRAVRARGRLAGPEVHVLVSTRDFGAGYRIVQAFETAGRRLLLDRGFIRLEDKDRRRDPGEIEVTGNLYWPDETDSFTPENDLGANIWYARDVDPLAAYLGTEPVMIVARQTAPDDSAIAPLPIDTAGIPNRHLEYVLTWYGLAVTWVLMSAYFLRRRHAKESR